MVAQTYVLLAYEQGTMPFGRMVSTLKFVVKEIDPSTGDEEEDGFEDEYPLEDVYCSPGDYLQPTKISNFRNAWDAQDPDTEVVDEYGIGQRDSLQDAVEAVVETLGLAACEGTEAVPLEDVVIEPAQVHCDDLEILAHDAVDDVADELALHGIGLEQDQGAI